MSEEKPSVDVCESVNENASVELSVEKTNDVECDEKESEESGEEMEKQCDCCVIEANAESTTEALTGKEKENENKTPLIKSLVLPWFFSFEPLRRESELRCNGFTRQLTAVSVPLTRSCTLSIRSFGRYTVNWTEETVVKYNGKEYPFTPRSSKALFNYDAISVGLILPSHLQAVTRCGVPINPEGAKVVTRHSQNGESEKRPTYVICNTGFFPFRREEFVLVHVGPNQQATLNVLKSPRCLACSTLFLEVEKAVSYDWIQFLQFFCYPYLKELIVCCNRQHSPLFLVETPISFQTLEPLLHHNNYPRLRRIKLNCRFFSSESLVVRNELSHMHSFFFSVPVSEFTPRPTESHPPPHYYAPRQSRERNGSPDVKWRRTKNNKHSKRAYRQFMQRRIFTSPVNKTITKLRITIC